MTAKVAVLVDKFHLTPDQIAGLTDYQISELYFHERDQHGAIVMPEEPKRTTWTSPAKEALHSLAMMRPLMSADQYAEARRKLLAKLKEEHSGRQDVHESNLGS